MDNGDRDTRDVRDTRDTVVVERERRSSYGWLVALLVVLGIILLFFLFGGANLFNGTTTETQTETINVDTPDSVQVTPTETQ